MKAPVPARKARRSIFMLFDPLIERIAGPAALAAPS